MPFLCCKSRNATEQLILLCVFVENVRYCSCSWRSHDFGTTRRAPWLLRWLLKPRAAAGAQCRSVTVLGPQSPCAASRNALRSVCLSAQACTCASCTCLQYHSDQLTALCFNENVASWANVLAYSQMERY